MPLECTKSSLAGTSKMARTTITSQPHPRLSDTVFQDREARRRRQQKRWTPSSPGPAPEVGHRCEGPRHKRPAADIQCPQTWQFTAGDGLPRWDSQGLADLISVLGDSIHRYQPNRQISRLPERRRRRLPSPSGTRGGGQRRRDSDRGNEQVARYSSTASRAGWIRRIAFGRSCWVTVTPAWGSADGP